MTTATIGIANSGLDMKQSAAVILLYCGSGLDEQSQTSVINIYL